MTDAAARAILLLVLLVVVAGCAYPSSYVLMDGTAARPTRLTLDREECEGMAAERAQPYIQATLSNPKPLLPWLVTTYVKRSAYKDCMAGLGYREAD